VAAGTHQEIDNGAQRNGSSFRAIKKFAGPAFIKMCLGNREYNNPSITPTALQKKQLA